MHSPCVSPMQDGILPSSSSGTGQRSQAGSSSSFPCQMEIEPMRVASVKDFPPSKLIPPVQTPSPQNGDLVPEDQVLPSQDQTSLAVNSIPCGMPESTNPEWSKLPGKRIFLDICCGVNSPLSAAVQALHGDHLRFDILIHSTDDLLDSTRFEQLLRVCASVLSSVTSML